LEADNNSVKLRLKDAEEALKLFGPHDAFLKLIESHSSAQILTRSDEVVLSGSKEELGIIGKLFNTLLTLIRRGINLSERDIIYAYRLVSRGQEQEFLNLYDNKYGLTYDGKVIFAKTLGQRIYVESLHRSDMVFGIGPAGTGKTFLAIVLAVQALKANRVQRIVLTRPAVEAGESLGFLPGDLQEKVDPYLRPLYDGLEIMLGTEQLTKKKSRGLIEIAPLAYMRGRTLDNAFVILDEAQNATPDQMKMFLTRLGFGSKMVVTGDLTQIDLPRGKASGLVEAERLLEGIPGIEFIRFSAEDVMRHILVQSVIDAYEQRID
jgi:phosphate starvation-inducible PhoH-like protein